MSVLGAYIRLVVESSMAIRRGFEASRRGMQPAPIDLPPNFSGSKLVDDLGKPLIFYHGTRRDFLEFRQEMLDTAGTSISTNYIGFYFTSAPEVAQIYISRRFEPSRGLATGGKVLSFVLNVRRPYYITEHTYWKWGRGSRGEMTELVDRLKSMGYDGIVMPSVWRGSGRGAYDVVVFDSSQIHRIEAS